MENKIEEFKYQEEWDKHDYAVLESQMTPKIAYQFGYEDAVAKIREWLEEEIQTNYDCNWVIPKEDGICGAYDDKWEFLSAFHDKFEKE